MPCLYTAIRQARFPSKRSHSKGSPNARSSADLFSARASSAATFWLRWPKSMYISARTRPPAAKLLPYWKPLVRVLNVYQFCGCPARALVNLWFSRRSSIRSWKNCLYSAYLPPDSSVATEPIVLRDQLLGDATTRRFTAGLESSIWRSSTTTPKYSVEAPSPRLSQSSA